MKKKKKPKNCKILQNFVKREVYNYSRKMGDLVEIQGIRVKVCYQNQGINFFEPIVDEPSWFLFKGLIVFKEYPNGEVKDVYPWGGR